MALPTLDELEVRAQALAAEVEELAALDAPTDEQAERFTAALAEGTALAAEIDATEARNAQLETVRSLAQRPGHVVEGTNRAPVIPGVKDRNIYDVSEARAMSTTNAGFEKELRSRALEAIVQAPEVLTDDQREHVTRSVERQADTATGRYLARHILATGSPEYRELFNRAIIGDVVAQNEMRMSNLNRLGPIVDEERTAMSTTNGNGGFLIPFELDSTVILTNAGSTDPFRDISTVKQTHTNVWHGVSSAGVTAEWASEAAQAADASPTFIQPTVTCYRADAYLQASFEVVADSDVAGDIQMLLADAKANLEAVAHATGSGSGQPFGVVTVIGGVTASRVSGSSGAAGAADFVAADVYALASNLPPRYRQNASWVAEFTILNKIRQFATGSGPQHAFWADLGMGTPPLLLGKPIHEASGMDNTIVSGSNDDVLIIGDFRRYVMADRIGMQLIYNPLVIGANARPTGEIGWFAVWRHGANVVDNNAFRLLRL